MLSELHLSRLQEPLGGPLDILKAYRASVSDLRRFSGFRSSGIPKHAEPGPGPSSSPASMVEGLRPGV